MALATTTTSGSSNGFFFSPSLFCAKPRRSPSISLAIPKSKLPVSSLRIRARGGRLRVAACSNGENLEEGSSRSSSKKASFDLKLPRRSLLVQFTCNACGERTERTINRVAYERGTVFVQCAGCLVNHKLVDNLGLVVEYDLRGEIDEDNVDSE